MLLRMGLAEMNELQKQLFAQMCEIDRVCRLYGIQYTLQGGTLLGAVRNQGFIPWDDDVDLAMTRENYERFKEIFPQVQSDYLICDDFTAGALQVFSAENGEATSDIFVYDFITTNPLLRKIRIYLIVALQAMLKTKRTIQMSQKNGHAAVQIFVYKLFWRLGFLFPQKTKTKWYRDVCQKCFTGNHTEIHLSNDSAKYLGRCIPSDYMSSFTEVKFEGRSFLASKEYDKILRLSYGKEYMTPIRDPQNSKRHEMFRDQLFSKQKTKG